VRQRYLALLSVFASLPAMALTFQTRWRTLSGRSRVTVRMPSDPADHRFRLGPVRAPAGEQATFRLNAYNAMLGGGSATLLAAAAPWQPGRGDINLGSVRIGTGNVLFNSSQSRPAD
jgi:hypothetical protein